MNKKEDGGLGKPSTSRASNAPKELYAYTPSWMTAVERSKLKARIRKIKKKEGLWGMKKEEDTLVQSSVEGKDTNPLGIPEERKDRDLAGSFEGLGAQRPGKDEFSNMSVILPDDGALVIEGTPTSDGPEQPASSTNQYKSDKSGASEHPKKKGASSSHEKPSNPNRSNKESLSKKKSKEELTMTKEKKKKHPKADHANPSGNLVKNKKTRTSHARNTLEEHLWVTDFEHFDPRLYSFKSPEKLSTKKPVVAECPPFWVLNDHTIAVAWKLYCKEADRGDLGIVALQWSREFVSAMKDETGEYPIAIKHLLDAIEDGLIYRYSRAAEDSKKAHQKSDDISYASSDSVFKPPTEVSYTLKDIMSRNFPGRQSGGLQQTSIVHKNDTTPVVHKTVVPVHDDPVMSPKDMVAFLEQMKIEQEVRVKHEMEMQREIEKLLKQVKDGKMPALQSERKDRVDFIVPPGHYDSDHSLMMASSPLRDAKGTSAKGKDITTTASGTSNRSAASDRTIRSSPSRVSFQDSSHVDDSAFHSGTNTSREATSPDVINTSYIVEKPPRKKSPSLEGDGEKPIAGSSGWKQSKEGAAKRQSKEGAAKRQSKESFGEKPSKENVGRKPSKESVGKKQSNESVGKKPSTESVAKKGSKESVAKKGSKESVAKKGSKESVAKKGSKESQASQKSSKGNDTKPKKGSKESKSGGKKSSKGSKGSKGSR